MNRKLVFIIVIESILLLILAYPYLRHYLHVSRVSLASYETYSPLELALEYGSPLPKFEQLVKDNPEWLSFRKGRKFSDEESFPPILLRCALVGRTDYMRILLENGADPEESLAWSRKYGSEDAANLVRKVSKVVQVKTNGIRDSAFEIKL